MSDDPELDVLLEGLEGKPDPAKKKEYKGDNLDDLLAFLEEQEAAREKEEEEARRELEELLRDIDIPTTPAVQKPPQETSMNDPPTPQEDSVQDDTASPTVGSTTEKDVEGTTESTGGSVSPTTAEGKPAVPGEDSKESEAKPAQEQAPKKLREKPADVEDPKGKLQHYYEVIAEKMSAPDVAYVMVWEGAVKNKRIERDLGEIVDDDSYLDERGAGRVANLFSSQLDSEKMIVDEFLPTLKLFATCGWEAVEEVPMYMLGMLLHKTKKRGVSLAITALPTDVFHLVLGDAVTKICEDGNWPKFVAKLPKPDSVLSPEQFVSFLLQDIAVLTERMESRTNWLFVLSHSPEGILDEVVSGLSKTFPWAKVFESLSALYENKEYYDQMLVKKAGIRVVRVWGETTSLEERKAALKQLKEEIDHKEFEKMLELILSTACYPIDDMTGNSDNHSLLVASPNTQLAVKLLNHSVKTLDKVDAEKTIDSLVKQKIRDERLAAVVREMSRLKMIDDEMVDNVIYGCAKDGLLQACAELLRVSPNPRYHPIMDILEEKDEKTCYKALELLSPDLYAPNCSPENTNALHLVATFGYTTVVKEILTRGFYRLLNKPGNPPVTMNDTFRQSIRPATIAVQATHFTTATLLLQAMELEDAKMLCTASTDFPQPEINLHKVMKSITSGRGGRWDQRAVENAEFKDIPLKLEKKELQERVEFMKAALDTTVDGRRVDLSLLIQDEQGTVSEQFSSAGSSGNEPDPEAAKKKAGETLYHKIARSECEELKSHESFATITSIIWIDYGIVQGMLFSFYLLFMVFLTTSLVLAARSRDPSQYDRPLDHFRLFCEVVTLIFVLYDLVLEIYELGSVTYRSLRQNSLCVCARRQREGGDSEQAGSKENIVENEDEEEEEEEEDDDEIDGDEDDDDIIPEPPTHPVIEVTKDITSEYFLNWQNMLDDLAILCTLLIIPFRIADSDTQWVFAALAFMFHGLRIFKYAIMFRSVGEYVAILILLIKRDVPQFVTVFVVIIFSLGGALYLSLIGYYNDDNIDTENNNDTSEIYLLWWTGFRILAEGSALTYYGPGGFNWLGVLIYWLFLFIVVVVLLNILIAQFSKSYEEETERAQINVIITRTDIILRMEQSALTRPCVRFVKKLRAVFTNNILEYESVERLKSFVGESENEKPASSEQVEELQTQTTNLGLQLRKQMEDNTGKSQIKVEEMKAEVIKETREALQAMREEIDGKLVGLERVVIDTRRYVDEIKELLLAMKDK